MAQAGLGKAPGRGLIHSLAVILPGVERLAQLKPRPASGPVCARVLVGMVVVWPSACSKFVVTKKNREWMSPRRSLDMVLGR